MTYIISKTCVGLKDGSCVDVCPVDCIYTTDNDDQYYINPEECIDCAEEDVPKDEEEYIDNNYKYFNLER